MSIANTFPIFEADQVLTNRHLNDLFNYLDEQQRLTRCKLIGSGIVCGLDISHTNNTINITKGCGITSQGYIILLCDHTGENGYKYYKPFTKPPFPADLEIISQCGDPDLTHIPFYASPDDATSAVPADIQLLLTQSDFDALSDKTGTVILSQAGNLGKYAVVLFLDAEELNLKNCDTNDCNDKGSLMDLEVKVLLVNKNLLSGNGENNGNNTLKFSPINLRRYNVPVSNLNSSDDVLNAFVNLLNSDSLLDTLANDLNFCYTTYKSLLKNLPDYAFGTGADFRHSLKIIQQSFPVMIQYFYDFVYDLVHAVYEFKYKAHAITSECCGDEMKFPFHLTLGEATTSTANSRSALRQYFIYSPLFDPQSQGANELRSLLIRLILMHQDILLTANSLRKGLPKDIRVTPSTWSRTFISERCIPYYYRVVHENSDMVQEDLYNYWNYHKTRNGNAKWNLSYDPTPYNSANVVVNPLFYDIEWYDFFRIEGHIGLQVNTALSDLVAKKQTLNLPFDVIALSADFIGALLSGADPKCVIQDLESDYRILIAEFICKLHDALCTAAKQKFVPPIQIFNPGLFELQTEAAKKKAKTTASAASKAASVHEFVNIALDHPFISTLVNEFQATAVYTKGDTLSRLCSPPDGTVGSFYIGSIKANQGKFVNPDPNTPLNSALFEFTDSVEGMLQVLMTQDISALNTAAFNSLNTVFEKATDNLKRILMGLISSLENKDNVNDLETDNLLDLLVDNEERILHTCIVEKLEALKNEYLRRVAQYRLAKNFNFYFKKNGGIEHKAGVPRSGTFILVYHEERKNRFVDVNSLFINQELSNTLLTSFRELLQPDVDLDTLEAQTKMLAISTLYKDPALYLKFKDVMQQYLDNCKDIPTGKKQQLINIINRPPAPSSSKLTDGMVIADFYVPYMCCSDCQPIAYILPLPAPLSVSQSDPVCDKEGKNYTVTLTVTGGTPPYSMSVNNSAVTGNQITLASGSQDAVVTITDAGNQSTTATVKGFTCVPPCTLPCNGLTEKCNYVIWLQRPGSKGTITKIQTKQATIELTDENGAQLQPIDVTDIFNSLLNAVSLTAKNYDKVFAKLFDAISSKMPANFIGNNQPVFSYDVTNSVLVIEKFTCQKIQLTITSQTFLLNDKKKNSLSAVYSSKGTSITIPAAAAPIDIPKFGCSEINKCTGSVKALCTTILSIKDIHAEQEVFNQNGNKFSIDEQFDSYFWYLQDCTPIWSNAPAPLHEQLDADLTFVRVYGIRSADGCFAMLEKSVKPINIIG